MEKAPGDEGEGPHEARPGRIDAAFDQRRNGERIGDREADIAEVEQRRMDRETGVLQDRVEVAALERRREPHERVRGQEDEGEEGETGSGPERRARRRVRRAAARGQTRRRARRRSPE